MKRKNNKRFKFSFHTGQRKVFDLDSRVKVLVAARRWGKSRLLLQTAVFKCLSYNQHYDPVSPPVVVIVCPTLKQAKQVHWKSLKNILKSLPKGQVKQINHSDYRVTFSGKRPDLLLRGANDSDGDGLRGLKIFFAGLDEAQDIKPESWDAVIVPAMADTPNSSALIIGTPKGYLNWLHRLKEEAEKVDNWSYHHFTTLQNPTLSKQAREEIERQRLILPPRLFRQEFEATFEDFAGLIFDCFERDRHIVKEIPSDIVLYRLGFDLGSTNPGIVVVGSTEDRRHFVVDSWGGFDQGRSITVEELCQEAEKLHNKWIPTVKAITPDDNPSFARSLHHYAIKNNIKGLQTPFVRRRTKPNVEETIQSVNSLFYQDRLFVVDGLTKLLEQIQSYHKDDEGKIVKDNDHLVDALRYLLADEITKI